MRTTLGQWPVPGTVALLLISMGVSSTESEHREHDAHEHGQGLLNVVAEGDELAIEFRMPAANVVGFEHEPSTDEQRHAVEEALAMFRRAEALFTPSEGAGCRIETVEVKLAGIEHHEGEEEGHHEDHAEEGHDDSAEHNEHAEETHSELHGEYHFHCESPEKLEQLQVHLFDHLQDAEAIEAQVVTATVQTAVELHPSEAVVELTR